MAQDAIDPAPGDPRARLVALRPPAQSVPRTARFSSPRLREDAAGSTSSSPMPTTNAERIAAREGCSMRKVNMTISLAFLAPNLVKAAIEGRLPHGMGVARLCDLPAEWSRQHQHARPDRAIAPIRTESPANVSPFPGNGIPRAEKKAPCGAEPQIAVSETRVRKEPRQIGAFRTPSGNRHLQECVVGPGVVPRHSYFNNLHCQTALSARTGAKDILLQCKIGLSRAFVRVT